MVSGREIEYYSDLVGGCGIENTQNTKGMILTWLVGVQFTENLEKVHAKWMSTHDALPKTSSERAQYKVFKAHRFCITQV